MRSHWEMHNQDGIRISGKSGDIFAKRGGEREEAKDERRAFSLLSFVQGKNREIRHQQKTRNTHSVQTHYTYTHAHTMCITCRHRHRRRYNDKRRRSLLWLNLQNSAHVNASSFCLFKKGGNLGPTKGGGGRKSSSVILCFSIQK